jgi:hypothetical protein
MLLMEADHKRRTAHLYLVQDEILHKNRVQLKLLYASRAYSKPQKIDILMNLTKIYFSLGKLRTALDCAEEASHLAPHDTECIFWKALSQFYLLSTASLTPKKQLKPSD